MIVRWGLVAVLFGIMLRVLAADAHVVPRGDVVLDVGAARSLAAGEGFRSGFERALPKLAGPDAVVGRQDLVDQHPPLWPLLGSFVARLGASPFLALKLLSLLAGVLVLVLGWRITDRLTEGISGVPDGLPALATGILAVGFLAVDAAGNGSLYAAQAAGVLLLVETLASPRPSWWRIGLVLGGLLMLNHQCAVLWPVPALVLLLGARPGERGRAAVVAAGATLVAALCALPWWLRNVAAFGDPFASVNPIYFLYRAGVDATFAVEDGVPVLRFARALDPLLMARASLGFLKPNLLYLLSTGLAVWPVLLGVGGAALLPQAWEAVTRRDRRLLALLVCLAALGAVAVLWPATKLRYLAVLQPLVVVLAVRAAARAPGTWARRAALLVGLGWLAALLLTLDDVRGVAEDARPVRWMVLAAGGALLLWLPVRVHGRARTERTRVGLLLGAMLVSWVLAAWVAVGGGPGTAYHATDFAPDFFGKQAELSEAREALALAEARDAAVALGAETVAGPIGLLAWPTPRLLEVSQGLPPAWLGATLDALLDAGRARHVVLLLSDAEALTGPSPTTGTTVLGGRLVVRHVVEPGEFSAGAVVLEATGG